MYKKVPTILIIFKYQDVLTEYMGQQDWYRKTSWSENIEKEFYERFNRSKGAFHKAQYLRIQATILIDTSKLPNIHKGIQLLVLLADKYPDEASLSSAYLELAQAYYYLKDWNKSEKYFKLSIETQKKFPNNRTNAVILYCQYILERNLTKKFNDALRMAELYEKEQPIYLAHDDFLINSVKAIVYDFKKDSEKSKSFAIKAHNAANRTDSGFKYHKSYGLVKNKNSFLYRKIETIIKKESFIDKIISRIRLSR